VAFLKFSEWHSAVKTGVAVIGTFSAIIGIYVGFDAWASDKIEDRVSETELAVIKSQAEIQARNEIDHDKITQRTRIVEAAAGISVTDLQLQILEEEIAEREEQGLPPTARQQLKMDRLLKVTETYTAIQTDATEKLTKTASSTITTTTTTTTEPEE